MEARQDGRRLVWERFQIDLGGVLKWGTRQTAGGWFEMRDLTLSGGFNKTAGGWFGRGPITIDWRDLNNLDNNMAVRSQ